MNYAKPVQTGTKNYDVNLDWLRIKHGMDAWRSLAKQENQRPPPHYVVLAPDKSRFYVRDCTKDDPSVNRPDAHPYSYT